MSITLKKQIGLAFAGAIILSLATSTLTVCGQQGPPRDQRQNKEENKPPRNDARKGEYPQKYNIEQAVSDNAQLHTIAFSGLAFITGDFGASTFIPPGKVCDFFGFQYMRDIDAAQKGHNPMFLDRVAGNVLHPKLRFFCR
ncbi:MAG: hypothetical protein WCP55_13295 [Lentisphaerota bacterium]